MPHSQMFALVLGTLATIGSAGKTALILIDVQDCFLEANTTSGKKGSLDVPASHIIPLINSIRNQKGCLFDKVIRTQDFHPAKHISFGSTHGLGAFSHLTSKGGLPLKCLKPTSGKMGDSACCPTYHINKGSRTNCGTELCPPVGWNYTVSSSGIITGNMACTTCMNKPADCMDDKQAMWSDHCMQTGDSTFPPTLVKKETDIIVKKGTNLYVDAYSGFMDNTQNLMTGLDAMLKKEGVDTLYVAGIATDVCVHATVRDAFHNKTGKYTVKVIKDATAAVQGSKANYDKAITEMMGFGATIITTADVLKMACPAGMVSGSNTTKAPGSNTTKMVLVVKGNIKFAVSMNATEAASFVKDAKVVLGVETGIAKQLKLAKVSWVKATLSVVTARRLTAAANATANINVDFVITVPAKENIYSASSLEASLKKTDQASKDMWKATLTTEIKKATSAHANLMVTVSSIAHTPVTTAAPGGGTPVSSCAGGLSAMVMAMVIAFVSMM